MCRVVSQEFGGTIAAVAEARGFVARSPPSLGAWSPSSSDAELLTSELVTNAVLHARGDVTVTLAVADGVAEIGVSDRSSDLPHQRSRTWRAEGGRGLRLVELVALEWGVATVAGGKQVWFRLDIDSQLAAPDRLPVRRRRPGAGPARVGPLRRRGARPVGRLVTAGQRTSSHSAHCRTGWKPMSTLTCSIGALESAFQVSTWVTAGSCCCR